MVLAAAVFDCDGTIADTEVLSERAWQQALAARGVVATADDFRAIIGHPYVQNWAYFNEQADLGNADEFLSELRTRFSAMLRDGLDIYEDAVATMRAVAAAGGGVAVASSSRRAHVFDVLDRAGLRDTVAVVVGADDVSRHKPEPDPYIRAVELLGVDPQHVSAVEDTAVGVTSATSAGLYTVGIVRRDTAPHELRQAHRLVDLLTIDALLPDAVRPIPHEIVMDN